MGFEDNLTKEIFKPVAEKTFVDKILGKDDIDAIRQIIRKKDLTREDLLEVLYLLSGSEAKLLNYSEYSRHVILKYFVWLRSFMVIAETLFDYKDNLKTKTIMLTPQALTLLDNAIYLLNHNAKFLIDLYLNIARTSLSVGATGLLEILKNKYEIVYPEKPPTTPIEQGAVGA